MPKLKGVAFETSIIERYRRRESSVEEALIKMYLAGVSEISARMSPKYADGLRNCGYENY